MRSRKERLAADLACRWWYVLPDWPVHDEAHYEKELETRSLRKVEIADWEFEPDLDDDGRKKVFELGQFQGCFRDSTGKLHDLRDYTNCPSYNNLMKKGSAELCNLLIEAYENQITALSTALWADESLEAELRNRQEIVRQLEPACAQSDRMVQKSKERLKLAKLAKSAKCASPTESESAQKKRRIHQ